MAEAHVTNKGCRSLSFRVHIKQTYESAKGAAMMDTSLANKMRDSKCECTRDLELAEIVAANGKQILRYCCAMLRDYHEAQDVVQTTFLKALSKGDSIKSELIPWLYKTAYNNCIDILRRRKWQRFLFIEERDSKAFYQMEDGMDAEVRDALGELTPSDRALVVCRVLDDLNYEQLSKIFNASPSALRKRYERAKKKLAEALRKQGLEVDNGKS